MEGNSKGWFPNGQQQFDYNFRNNLEHGVCTEWNEVGQKISELQFIDGQPIQDLLTGRSLKPIENTEELEVPSAPTPTNEQPAPETTVKPDSEAVVAEDNASEETDNASPETVLSTEESTPPAKTNVVAESPAKKVETDTAPPATQTPPTFDPFSVSTEPKEEENKETPAPEVISPPPPAPPPPAPSFDPFANDPVPPVAPSESPKTKVEAPQSADFVPPPPPPPPPAPSFNPFENDPLPPVPEIAPDEESSPEAVQQVDTVPPPPPAPPPPAFDPFSNAESATGNQSSSPPEGKLDIPPPPPPPPAPTFNPFDSDPLPPPPPGLSEDGAQPNAKSNPFESVKSDKNESSVPLENIFNTPPLEAAPADNFNPFDLPTEN
jgi:hypothetical protein